MGRYTTWDLVTGRYDAAAKRGGSSEQQNYFIAGAEGEIDGYLAKRYTLPLTPAPDFLVDLATDLVFWKLSYGQKVAEPLRKSIDARLQGLRDGTITLVGSGSGALSTSNLTATENKYRSSFGHDNPINWSVDRDALIDDRATRQGDESW